MFFSNRRPRGFRHQFIYVDERKKRLAQLEASARREIKLENNNRDRHEMPLYKEGSGVYLIDRQCKRLKPITYAAYIGILCLIGCLCVCVYYIMYVRL